jgi:hypothetical protein
VPLIEPTELAAGQLPQIDAAALPFSSRHRRPRAARGRPDRVRRQPLTDILAGQPRPGDPFGRMRTLAGSRLAWLSRRVPTVVAGIYGMNFEHMPDCAGATATRR